LRQQTRLVFNAHVPVSRCSAWHVHWTHAYEAVRGHPLPTSALSAFSLRPFRLSDVGVSPSSLTPSHFSFSPLSLSHPPVLTSSFLIFPWTLYIANLLVRGSPFYSCGNSFTRYGL
jgi:hypothetical protein